MDQSEELSTIGSKLEQLRRERGLTLEKVSELSGVSASLLSQLERGMGNPSLTTLTKIAYGLGVPISLFFEGLGGSADRVVRKKERKKLLLSGRDLIYELLTPDLNRAIEFVWAEVAPGVSTAQHPFVHQGEEAGLVLQGTLEVHIGDKLYVLEAGDSISYPADIPHWHRNPGEEKAICIWVITPPSF